MKRIIYFIFGLFFLASCFEDEGNYDYSPINEIRISGFGEKDTTYLMLYQIDTLKIEVGIKGTLDSLTADRHCSYRWELGNDIGSDRKTVATTRDLVLPMDMKPGQYTLYYKVKDETNGVIISESARLEVGLSYSKGLLVLGDREDGTVQLDMVAMIDARKDTTVLRDVLKDSGLPVMRHGRYVCHTGSSWSPDNVKLWIMCDEGSYYLDAQSMTGSAGNTFSSLFYTSLDVPRDVMPVLEFPAIAGGNGSGRVTGGSNRGYILNDGSAVWANIIQGEFYGNPLNRTQADPKRLLKLFPHAFYSPGYMSSLVVYDTENERFMVNGAAYNPPFLNPLRDQPNNKFPWNQGETGRTLIHGDNTRNRLGNSSSGRSYALMKDKEGRHFIYCFYADRMLAYGFPTSQKGYWEIRNEVATEIGQAEHFAFSSTAPILYYTSGSRIYAYNYTLGHEKCAAVADLDGEEITWFAVDYWSERSFDQLFVCTYSPAKGGTVRKFRESDDQNKLELTRLSTEWGGFPRIKCLGWRNSSY